MIRQRIVKCVLGVAFLLGSNVVQGGNFALTIVDSGSTLLPCRVHLKDVSGKPQHAAGLPFWDDHFVCPGTAEVTLAPGEYTLEIERGPEYERHSSSLTIDVNGEREVRVRLRRIADLSAQGWFSGDLHIHRPVEDVGLLMRAEDLHVGPVITWWNGRDLWKDRELPSDPLTKLEPNRYYNVMVGEDEREGGALMFYGLRRPVDIRRASVEFPSPLDFVAAARRVDKNVWIDVEKPFWWDVPTWITTGEIDSIGLANNHMCRSKMYESEAWGKSRDVERLPPPRGNGYWTQELYYHVLNSGLRIPPSAGSASGVLPNPVGYNRAYVYVGDEFTYEKWWAGLKAGRSFVTNGPLLLCTANEQLPGHVFHSGDRGTVSVRIDGKLISVDRVPMLEVIKNGRVERTVSTSDFAKTGTLGEITFESSGWFLVRAIADEKRTFRFATTAPFYVEVGSTEPRVSRRSAQFFLDWTDERINRIKNGTNKSGQKDPQLADSEKLRRVLSYHERAREYWQQKVVIANAE